MSHNILVLGATGKVGRRLTPILRGRGIAVRAASRKEGPGSLFFDWARPEIWAPAMESVDAIFLVGPELVEDPSAAIAAFLRDAREAGVRRVVAVSSLGVTFPGEPINSGRLKVEAAVRESGLEWTILRPGGFSQNFSEGFFAPGIQAGMVRTATGSGEVAFIDAGDIAVVAAAVLTQPGHHGQIYALTGPRALSFAKAVDIIGQVMGRSIDYAPLTEEEFRSMVLGFGLPLDFTAVVVRDQLAIRDGYGAEVTQDVERVTGRRPAGFGEFAAQAFTRA